MRRTFTSLIFIFVLSTLLGGNILSFVQKKVDTAIDAITVSLREFHPSLCWTDLCNCRVATEVLKSSQNEYKREILAGLLSALVYKVIDLIRQKQNLHTKFYLKSTQRSEILFDRFMLLLNTYHIKEHSVKFYASQMNLTANVIKEFSGKTAAQWIDEYVVLGAQTLLKFSGISIQEIAYHLNFATQSSFGKYFKQQTGMSPKQFINQ